MESEVEITWQGKKIKVLQRVLKGADRNRILERHTNFRTGEVNAIKVMEEKLVKSIIQAPFQINAENVGELDEIDQDRLLHNLVRMERLRREEAGEIEAAIFPGSEPKGS